MENKKCMNKQCFCDGSCKKPPVSLIEQSKNKDIVQEYFELQKKRNKSLEMPINSLTIGYIESLGKSELEKKIEKHYDGFTLMEFLNHTSINKK